MTEATPEQLRSIAEALEAGNIDQAQQEIAPLLAHRVREQARMLEEGTQYHFPFARLVRDGTHWRVTACWPTEHLLGTHESRESAEEAACYYGQRVAYVLKRARSLR